MNPFFLVFSELSLELSREFRDLGFPGLNHIISRLKLFGSEVQMPARLHHRNCQELLYAVA